MTLNVIQLGLNSADLPGTLLLFSEAFGFQNGGGQILARDVIPVQGLGRDAHTFIWWMVGSQPLFQLEFFQHTRPAQRPLRADWTAADHGWVRFGIAVADFDATWMVLRSEGIEPLAPPVIVEGARRAAFRDPYIGVIVEVMEMGPAVTRAMGEVAAPAVVYAAASVSDLDAARAYYGEIVGLALEPIENLHAPGSDSLWGLDGAESDGFLARAAGGPIVEIVRYTTPTGRPRPKDYRSSDQGFVNIALGSNLKAPVAAALAALEAAGHTPPHIVENDMIIAGYIVDPEREIELATAPDEFAAYLGWVPANPFLVSLS